MSVQPSQPVEHIEIRSADAWIEQFALRTARADIIDYTIAGCDLRGPELTQVVHKRTWGRVTYRDCLLDDDAKRHIEGTGGTVVSTHDA